MEELYFVLILLTAISLLRSEDQVFSKFNYPNIVTDLSGCGRPNNTKHAAVCDPANILTDEQAKTLDNDIASLRNSRSCVCHRHCGDGPFPHTYIKIGIAIIPEIVGDQNTTSERETTVYHFADFLRFHKWDFGQCSDDIVIALAIQEKQVETSSGYTSRDILVPSCVRMIHEESEHYFTDENYYEGLRKLVEGYSIILRGGDDSRCRRRSIYSTPSEKDTLPWWAWVLVAFGIAAFIGLVTWCRCKCKGGGGLGASYWAGGSGGGGWGGGDGGGDCGGGGGDF